MNISTQSSLSAQAKENWEFLLQKEGDRSWLPLDSPTVEILEGRYRVVARSNHPNTAVEIRIAHLATAETPPKRRTQKRSGRTNANGLMVVAPYTKMKPGIWDLSCCGDLMSELIGQGLYYAVQLHVLPQDANPDDWEPNWHLPTGQRLTQAKEPVPATSQATQTEAPTLSPPDGSSSLLVGNNPFLQRATELSQQIVDHSVAELDAAATIESTTIDAKNHAGNLPPESVRALPSLTTDVLQILLSQTSYVIHRGENLTLSGQVMLSGAASLEELIAATDAAPLDRILALRDPQTGNILLIHRESVPVQPFPWSFSYDLGLPLPLSTRLMLGEITFSQTHQTGIVTVLGSQSFTLISALNELLEAIADEAVVAEDSCDWVDGAQENGKAAGAWGLNLSFLGFVSEPKPSTSQTFFTIRGQVLPPQLYQPRSTPETPQKTIDLPRFAPARVQSALPELSPIDAPDLVDLSDPDSATVAVPLHAPPSASSAIELLPTHTLPPDDDFAPVEPLDINPFFSSVEAEMPTYPIADEFLALKLQDRFLNRLTAFATDLELSEHLRENLPPSERFPQPDPISTTSTTEEGAAAIVVSDEPILLDPEAELLAQEVVVDDPAELAYRAAIRNQPTSLPQTLPPELVLPEDEPVPVPILRLPNEELVAGKTLLIQVKLPNLLPRIHVKLWLNDRQTRSLLEAPRWLVDFMPDGLGDQVATTELTVPFGTVEIAIEAIAIEISTQRESHKTIFHLPVIPPDMPELDLDAII